MLISSTNNLFFVVSGGQGASDGTFTRQTSSRAAGQWNRSYHHNEVITYVSSCLLLS